MLLENNNAKNKYYFIMWILFIVVWFGCLLLHD